MSKDDYHNSPPTDAEVERAIRAANALKADLRTAREELAAAGQIIADRARERDEARAERDAASRILGEVCTLATLARHEMPSSTSDHAAVQSILTVLGERDGREEEYERLRAEHVRLCDALGLDADGDIVEQARALRSAPVPAEVRRLVEAVRAYSDRLDDEGEACRTEMDSALRAAEARVANPEPRPDGVAFFRLSNIYDEAIAARRASAPTRESALRIANAANYLVDLVPAAIAEHQEILGRYHSAVEERAALEKMLPRQEEPTEEPPIDGDAIIRKARLVKAALASPAATPAADRRYWAHENLLKCACTHEAGDSPCPVHDCIGCTRRREYMDDCGQWRELIEPAAAARAEVPEVPEVPAWMRDVVASGPATANRALVMHIVALTEAVAALRKGEQ